MAVAAGATVIAVARYRAAERKPTVRLETAVVDRGPVAAKVTATGSLSALVTVSVGSQVSGRIDKLLVDFGSVVSKGQTLATIDPSFFDAAVAQARANLGAAKAAVDKAVAEQQQAARSRARANDLFSDGLTSRADLEAAEADLEVADAAYKAARAGAAQAKAALDQAELNRKYTTIVSPIDGVVISRNVDVGQTVAAALQAPTLLLVAEDLTRMQVDTNVAEADVGKIRPAMGVTFGVDAYPERTFRGVVRQVRDNAQTIQNVVTYDAVIDVANDDRLLKPGMTASVTFVYATRENALRLPNAALRFKPDVAMVAAMSAQGPAKIAASHPGVDADLPKDGRVVWVNHDGFAYSEEIRVGISDGTFTEVRDGELHEGDQVVVEANAGGAPTGPYR